MNLINNFIRRIRNYIEQSNEKLENMSRDCQFLSGFKNNYENRNIERTCEGVQKYIEHNYEVMNNAASKTNTQRMAR